MLSELSSFKDQRLIQMDDDRAVLEGELVKKESYLLYCRGIVDNEMSQEMFRANAYLQTTTTDFLKTLDVKNDGTESFVSFTPTVNNVDSSTNHEANLIFSLIFIDTLYCTIVLYFK